MNVKRPLTPTITIGDQPTEADLTELKQEGYTAVVNLRNDGEPDQPLSTAAEGDKVRELGMDYFHHGVGSRSLTVQGVKEVCDFIDKHSQGTEKVLVHCRRGPRAIAILLLQQARIQKWTNAEVFAKGKAMGLELDGGLKLMVDQFLQDSTG
jgi:uncharacterized protein (TIGR01244 family)